MQVDKANKQERNEIIELEVTRKEKKRKTKAEWKKIRQSNCHPPPHHQSPKMGNTAHKEKIGEG
jgi:hypothetical protein